ncbi:Protein of unknown function [Cotesia congregata]|uniref:Uncharacterized protein n=1 Tax=Cotesia congregata TaxID=51543 RepID=A0A8J2MQS8_COTCN|nr:Protein of unknown function [Cotesia congregata]
MKSSHQVASDFSSATSSERVCLYASNNKRNPVYGLLTREACETTASVSASSKEGSTARLAERTSQNIEWEVEEGPIYGSGIRD